MKTNIVDALERNARAGKKCIEPKSRLAMLLLVCVALAVGACETLDLESNNPVEPVGGQPYYAGYTRESGFAAGLSGRWYHDGQPTSISVSSDGRNVTIINEQGQRASGYMSGNHELVISSLGIRGHVGHGGRRIAWANGHRVDPLIEDKAINRTFGFLTLSPLSVKLGQP